MTTDAYDSQEHGAREDLLATLRDAGTWWFLAWHGVRQQYRRSLFGPFWITIILLVLAISVGLVFGALFDQKPDDFILYVVCGLCIWTFVSGVLGEAGTILVTATEQFRQTRIPFSMQVFRVVATHVIGLGHNLIAVGLVLIFSSRDLTMVSFLAIPGLALIVANMAWIALLLAPLGARFRDVPMIVTSALQVLFLLTPIIWRADMFDDRPAFVYANPFYHMIEAFRGPVFFADPALLSLAVSGVLAVLGWFFAVAVFTRCHRHIAFWL